jgi:hypothetical protein
MHALDVENGQAQSGCMRTGERGFSSNRAFLSAVAALLARHVILMLIMFSGAFIIVFLDMA